MSQRRMSVVTPCFNEVGNVRPLYDEVKQVVGTLPGWTYEHIFIDNASTDGTQEALRELARQDKRVRVIINVRNFGHIRSPYHGLLQAHGDVVVYMASDLQDPPSLIPEFLRKWEEGYKVVLGVKTESDEAPLFFALRKAYYYLVNRLSNVRLTKNATGFGLYDQTVVEALRGVDDAYPYFRGLVAELGYEAALLPFRQPARKRGFTKNNFYTLYDIAMLGITSHSKVPLRLATMLGFACSGVSFVVALGYLVAKLIFWDRFTLGIAPLILGLSLFASLQLFFTGMLGEYIGAIHTQVLKRPLVVEKERINF